jgi:hypothetical protein
MAWYNEHAMNRELLDYLKGLEIIDTHEHLTPREEQRSPGDVLSEYLTHYFSVDLVNAGLPPGDLERLRGGGLDIREKWKLVEPYWELCRYTGYGQCLDRSVRGVYGIGRIDGHTIETLNQKFTTLFTSGAHYQKVLKDLSKIRISLLDMGSALDFDKEYFISVNNIGGLVRPLSGEELVTLENRSGLSISSFDQYLEACEAWLLGFARRTGSPVLKCALAYNRSLAFERAGKAEAERGFNEFFGPDWAFDKASLPLRPSRAFENYVMRHILGIAQRENLVLQIHTGLQEGTGNRLGNSNPVLLSGLFLDYPKLRFDLFHIGYPYQKELGALCKMFPNVSVDMCWAHIISPEACVDSLSEWLELFPYNKICGFGGDYCLVDGVFGHQEIARENIARALSLKMEKGLFGLAEARKIGKALLYDNPARIFGIS